MNQFLRITNDHKATFLCLIPSIVSEINASDDQTKAYFERVRIVMSGISTITPIDGDKFKQMYTFSLKCFQNSNFL